MTLCLWWSFSISVILFSSTSNAPSSWSWKPFQLLYLSLLLIRSSPRYCLHCSCVLQLISGCHWIVSTFLQQQLFSGLNKASLNGTNFLKYCLEDSLCLLPLFWDNLYSLPFEDRFFTLCPLPKILCYFWTSQFCFKRFNCC